MSRYVRDPKLTEIEAAAVLAALDTDISLRREAVVNELGDRIEVKGDALDDPVSAMERAKRKVEAVRFPALDTREGTR